MAANKTIEKVRSSAKKSAQAGAKQEGQLVEQNQPKTLASYIKDMYPAIRKSLPGAITPERFSRLALDTLVGNPALKQCTPQSFCGAMLQAAQLGLEPNTPTGEAYLIPYKNRGVTECQLQVGYKGLIELARRSGEITRIDARVVYSNDPIFEYEYGWDPKIRHVPALTNKGEPIAFYAIYRTRDGGGNFEVMSIDEIKAHAAQYSKSYQSRMSPWQTDFKSMACKTVIKQLLKYAPMSVEVRRGVAADETIKSIDFQNVEVAETYDIVDAPNEFDYEAAAMEEEEARQASQELEMMEEPFPA